MKTANQMMSKNNVQIPLNFPNQNYQTLENFEVGENDSLVESLNSFLTTDSENLFYFYGAEGSGKSHLLNGLVEKLKQDGISVVIPTTTDIANRSHVSLIQMFDVLCLDGIEKLASDSLLEESLFFWINEVRQYNKKLILSCQFSAKNELWKLPDLRSRLLSGRTHQIKPLNRKQTWSIFFKIAAQKGINFDEKAESYLQKQLKVNLKFLMNVLDALESAIHAEKRKEKISIHFINKILPTVLE
ncbi:MAG TPA: DnaA/Hda family protein [Gammaproteobacteria bacterium]|nr:hypothetical protein [Xanthomonadales bacterium]HOP21300.1 DnaA/Hda family protein [Gammaproteobacteria bacterium]HPI94898.1 DnaA/Hda family protein [Gammaproteobacteria bacterium]HPQ86491.1 DnaA/Hda family protein [Gammaproteobacteria bacterium]